MPLILRPDRLLFSFFDRHQHLSFANFVSPGFARFGVILLLSIFLGLNANAQSTSWIPTTGGDWAVGGNWTNGVPASGYAVTIGSDQSANITNIPTINLSSLTIGGNCTFAASVSGNIITVTSTFSVASGKTFVVGAGGARMNFIMSSTSIGSISGTVRVSSFAGGANRFFQNDGDLTIASPGIINDDGGTADSDFILSSGATLRIGSTTGITTTPTLSGNIQVVGVRTFSTGANYVYNGTANQAVGNGLPATVASLTVDNTGGGGNNTVTLGSVIAITNALSVSNGVFAIGANNITGVGSVNMTGTSITGSGTITLGGNVNTNASASTASIGALISLTGTRTFTVAEGAASADLSISSAISGGFGVIKAGNGLLSLSGANGYTGATTVSAGTLQIGASASPLGTVATGTTISAGAMLDLNGFSLATAEPLSLSGTGISSGGALTNTSATSVTYSGLVTLGAAAAIVANNGRINVSHAGPITGAGLGLTLDGTTGGTLSSIIGTVAGTVTKNGTGNWTLSGSSTYTGLTTINAGTLILGAAGAGANSPLGTTGSGTVVASGAVLDLNGFTLATGEPLNLSGTGIASGGALTNSSATNVSYSGLITLGASSSIVANAGTIAITTGGTITGSGFDLTLDGTSGGSISQVIGTNAGTVTKNGTGIWTISSSSTYTGVVTINAGTLRLGIAGGGTNTPLGTTASGTTVNSGAVLDLNGFTLGTAEPLTINGTGIASGGALTNSSASNISYSGLLTLGSSSSIVTNAGTIGITNVGTILGGGFNLTLDGSSGGSITSVIGTGSGAITKNGSGTWTLSGSNTFTGGVSINAGILRMGNAGALNSASPNEVRFGAASTGRLQLNGNSVTISALNSDIVLGTPIVENGSGVRTLTINNSGSDTFAGVVQNGAAGTLAIIKDGTGSMTLSGSNTYSGSTTLTLGTLNINNATAIGTGTFTITSGTIDNTSGGALTLASNNIQNWNGNFTFTGTHSLNLGTGAVTPNAARQVTVNANTLTVGGAIGGGAISLTKLGNGALTLSGSNTFTGGFTLNAGTVNINRLNALGTVAGTFTINGGTFDNTTGAAITTVNYPQAWNGDFTFTGTQNLNLGTGAVTMGANRAITVSANTLTVGGIISGGFDLAKSGGGTLSFGNNAVTLGSLSISAGILTSTSGTLNLSGNFTNSGSFNHNNGTVHFNGGATQSVASVTYNNLTLAGAGQKNAVGAISVGVNLVNSSVLDMASYALTVSGSITNTGGTIKFSGASNGFPISTGTVEFYGSSQTIPAGTYNSLTINQSAGEAVLGGDVTVNGILTLTAGNLNLAGHILTLASGATITVGVPSASLMIIATGVSEVRKIFTGNGLFIFPIGDNTGTYEYSPITVDVTGSSYSSAYISVSVVDAKHPSNASSTHYLSRYWNVTQSGITTGFGAVTATYVPADVNGVEGSINSARLSGTFNQSSNPWIKYGALAGTVSTTSAAITAGITSAFTGITGGGSPTASITGGGVTICVGSAVALNTVATGDPTLVYSWSPAAGLSATNIANPTASPTITTLYTVTVRDGNGIIATDNTTITVDQIPTPSAAGADQEQCNSGNFTLAGNPATISSGLWTIIGPANGAVITTPGSEVSTVTGLNPGFSVTIRWTISNGVCTPSADDVVLTNTATPTLADAGINIDQCNTSTFTMAANVAAVGTGLWTVQLGTATITNNTSPTTTITGIAAGTAATLRWTISNGSCAPTFEDIILTNYQTPTVSAAGADQEQCNSGNFTLAGNVPTISSGLWTIIGPANGSVITTPGSEVSTVTGLNPGFSVTIRWTISNGVCTPSADDVILTNTATPTLADAGINIDQCNTSTFTMAANTATTGTGLWTVQLGTATITNNTSPTTTVTAIAAGTAATLRWTISNGSCAPTFEDIVLTNYQTPTVSAAGADQEQCNSGNFTLAGNPPAISSGLWTIIGPANGTVITTPASEVSTVTGLNPGFSVTLRWTISNGVCTPSADDVVLTNTATPTVADAGINIDQCNTSTFTMAANVATVGTGLWTVQLGTATITNNTSPTTTITGIAAGTAATLRWTISNGSCAPTFEDIILTNYQTPTVSAAGADQEQCNSGNFTLAGNVPTISSGLWTIIGPANGSVITTPGSEVSTVTGLNPGFSVTIRWTISNGVCTPSADDVVLTNTATPTLADAGINIDQCNTSTFTMAANVAAVGTGLWTVQLGTATITNNTSPTTTITGIAAGTAATLRWTISNGSCAPTFEDIVLTNYQTPTVSAAGADQEQCNSGNFTLAGNVPTISSGLWTIIGPANGTVITTPGSEVSTVTGLNPGFSVTIRWTISNGVCTPSADDVILTNTATPTLADAGINIDQCNTSTFTMAANTATTGTGLWTVQLGTATITNNTSPTTTVTAIAAGTAATLRWTISNGSCAPTFEDIVLTNYQTPTVSAAGADQEQCNSGNFTLAGNPPAISSGLWTIIGPANGTVITTPASEVSTVTGLNPGFSVTLRWTISNGVCTPSADDVVLTNTATPTLADAGINIDQCNTSTFTMAANTATTGTGLWTVQLGTATITNNTSPTTTITGIAAGTAATLRWTISNGSCAPTFEDIVLTNYQTPTVSAAGADQEQCNSGNFTLAGNPATISSGLWTIIGPANGSVITTPGSEVSTVTGLNPGFSVTIRWTISNGVCTPSADDVVLTNTATPTLADAGINIDQCNTSTFTMAANVAAVGTGLWTVQLGTATITNNTSPTTTITGIAAGTAATLRWTISNGSCAPTFEDIILTNYQTPTVSAAGADQEQCNSGNFTLAGNVPTISSGLWTIIGPANGSVITTPGSEVSTVTGLNPGFSVTLRWTISNGVCIPSADDVILTNTATPTLADAGINIDQCNTSTFTMAANVAAVGTGLWTVQLGTATITNNTSPTTTITGIAAGTAATLRWTISNGSCAPTFEDIILTNYQTPTVSAAGADQEQCNSGNFTLAGNVPTISSGLWTIIGPANGSVITTPGSEVSTVTGLNPGFSVTIRWTISNGVCTPSADDVVLTNTATPTLADAGINIDQCNTSTFTMAANVAAVGTGLWTVQLGTATITNNTSPTTTITGIAAGTAATLRWTISNGSCAPTFEDIVLTNYQTPTVSAAGADQEQCNSGNFTLAGNVPTISSGLWTIIGPANGTVITTPASEVSTVTGLNPGFSVTLRWTISNGVCTPSADDVVLTNTATPTVADAGINIDQCNTSTFTMAANTATTGTGLWTVQLGTATITNNTSPTTTITGIAAGTAATLRWTISNGSCAPTFEDIILTNYQTPTVSAAGADQEQCNSGNFTLAGNVPTISSGLWTIIGPANGTVITTPGSEVSTVTGLNPGFSVTIRWTISNGSCAPTFEDIVLTNYQTPTVSAAGADQEQCNSGNFTLAGNVPTISSGLWTIIGPANGAVITTPASEVSTVTGLNPGFSVTLRWTISNGVCTPSADDVVLTNTATPTLADAGINIDQCNTSTFTMAANTATTGTGLWTVQLGTATITNNTSPTTTITGIAAGTAATLRWTISNGSCAPTFEDIVLTNYQTPTVSAAGADQEQCNSGNFTLAGNVPTISSGLWTIIGPANGSVITTPGSEVSTVTGLNPGFSVTIRWTISNGVCTPSADDVVLTNTATPTLADAGINIDQCNTSTFTMAANVAAVGTGLWTVQLGTATITNNTSPTTTITGIAAGTAATLRWTISNGSCAPTFEDIILTNYQTPTVSAAGADQEQCNSGNFTLAGNVPTISSGLWTIIGPANGSVITTPGSEVSTVTGLNPGFSVTIRWTISNGVCTPSADDVVLTNTATPTVADAGINIDQCNTSTFTMAANTATTGTGLWTVQLGTATITNNTSPTTTITGIAAGTAATLRWTISNGSCAPTFEDIILTNYQTPTVSAAGADQEQCNSGNFTLAGNVPTISSGLWTIIGPANGTVITTPGSEVSTVTGLNPGFSVTIRWTISNGVCTPSADDVILTNTATPTLADAGINIDQCNTSTFTMAANTATTGTGLWTVQLGTATITNNTSPTTTITGIAAGTAATLRWTISNGSCAPTFEDIVLTNYQTPTVSAAGADQEQCNSGNFTLAGNVPTISSGLWTIIGPANGSVITTPGSEVSTVTGLNPGFSVTIRWTISNGVCTPSADDVVLTNTATPTVADAGINIDQCNTSTFTMAANTATTGTGLWTVQLGTATITNNTSPTTTITGIAAGTAATLRWTISNGSCAPTFEDIILTNYQTPTVSAAGADQEQCNSGNFTLAGNVPTISSGLWTIIGPANGTVITTPGSEVSTVTGLNPGFSVTIRWTISNGVCTPSADDVILTNTATPTLADAGINIDQCNTSTFTMAANTATTGTGLWTVQLGTATITNNTSPTTTITGIAAGTAATLRWTISNGSCAPTFEDIVLTNYQTPTVSAAGADQEQCNSGNFTLAGNVPTISSGLWTIIGPANGAVITTPASEVSTVTGLNPGFSVTLRWTISNGVCTPSADDVVLTNTATPTLADAGINIDQCNTSTFTMAANTATTGTGLWTVQLGTATITNNTSPTTTITGIAAGTAATLRWTISNGSCAPTFEDIVLTNYQTPTVSAAGADQEQCNSGNFTLAGNPATISSGLWTIIGPANGSVITTPGSEVSTVTGLNPGFSVTIRWTISNGVCTPSADDVVLTNTATPTLADAGINIDQCNTSTFTMAANTATTGTGLWTVQLGTATITNNTSPTTTITGIAAGTAATLRWTISNGSCAPTFEDIVLTNYQTPTVSAAGADQEQCNSGNFTLAGNVPTISSGLWTIIGPANGTVITTPGSEVSTVTGLNPGFSVTIRWTISNGVCTPSADDVVLTNTATPTLADAGINIDQCNTSTFTMAANTATTGTGLWTVQLGTATITNNTSPTTTITGIAAGTAATLRWTISNGSCAPTFEDIVLTNYQTPTVSAAGADQEQCNSGNFTLAGNVPTISSGLWTIIGPANGSVITTPGSEVSTVTGLNPGFSVTIRWTISNGVCTPSADDVVLTNTATPTLADAGINIDQCNTSTFTMAANVAAVGTGLWTVQLGTATITNNTSPTTTITGIAAGTAATLRWTISNGSCAPTFEDIVLTNDLPPTTSAAGPDQILCSASAILAANAPVIGTGIWTIISGVGGSFVDNTDPLTTFNGTQGVIYNLRWTTTNGTCSSTDDVVIELNLVPDAAAGNQVICSGQVTNVLITNPNSVPGTTYTWTVISANVTGASNGSGATISQLLTSTDGITSGTATYTITPSSNGCNGTPVMVTVTVDPVPVITNTPSQLQITICSATSLSFTPSSTIGGTNFNWTSSTSGPIQPASVTAAGSGTITDSPVNTGNVSGMVTYTITPSVGSCTGVPVTYVVTINPVPTATTTNQAICSGQSTSVTITDTPTSVSGTTFTWTVVTSNVTGASNGSGATISQVLTSTDGISGGTASYTIIPSANGCSGNPVVSLVTVNPVPVITNTAAQLTTVICSATPLSFTPTSTIGGTVFNWTSGTSGPILPASVTAVGIGAITDTPLNTGNVAGFVTYTITPSVGSCSGTPVSYFVTVQPTPSANGTDVTICSGQTISVSINPSPVNVAGTTFSWIVIPTANVTGALADNGSTIIQTLTLTDFNVGSVIYRITPVANSCSGPTKDITVTVNPIPTVNAGPDFAVCEPPSIPLSGNIGGAATSGTWVLVTGAGTLGASTTTLGVVTANYTVAAADIATTVVFRLDTNDPDGGGPCVLFSDLLNVAINRAPIVTAPADLTVCEPVNIPVTGVIGGSATTGLWSIVSGNGILSATNVSGLNVSASYAVDPSDVGGIVTLRLTTNDPDGFGPCVPVFDDIVITVNQAAQVFAPANLAQCRDVPGMALGGSIGGSTTTIVWSGGAGTFSSTADPNATYFFSDPAEVNTNVTLTLTALDPDAGGPCTSVFTQTVLRINPLPSVIFLGLPATRAENQPAIDLSGFNPTGTGGLFTISPSTSNIGSTIPGPPFDVASFDPSAVDLGINTVTYTFTDANSCTNSYSQDVLVNPVTTANWIIDPNFGQQNSVPEWEICAEQGDVPLIGIPVASSGQPGTLFFASTGINTGYLMQINQTGSNFFIDTDGLPSDTYQVTYVYINAFFAVDSLTQFVKVFGAPNAMISSANNCIVSAVTFSSLSSTINPTPYPTSITNWAWDFGDFTPLSALQNPSHLYTASNNYNVKLSVRTGQGCTDTTSYLLRVGNLPIVDFGWSAICNNDSTKFNDLTSNLGISFITNYDWAFGDTDILNGPPPPVTIPLGTHSFRTSGTYKDPNHAYVFNGPYSVTLTVVTNDGCMNSLTKPVFILPASTVTVDPLTSFQEPFEATDGGWVPEVIDNAPTTNPLFSWQWGTPSGPTILPMTNAWWTGANVNSYQTNEKSAINGPCFDLRGLKRPMISFDYWVDTQKGVDGIVLQYSIDGGLNWENIGVKGEGINWYDPITLIAAEPGDQQVGWSGNSGQWLSGRFNLDTIPKAQRDQVRIRFAFASDGTTPTGLTFDGFALDNVFVGEKSRNVLVEHFSNSNSIISNAANTYLDNLYNSELSRKDSTDFNLIQYHINYPQPDQFYNDNKTDQGARALSFGVSQSPTSIMDGLLNSQFTGIYSQITRVEIDRESLRDHVFKLDLDTIATSTQDSIRINLDITSVIPVNYPIVVQVALVDNGFAGFRNVFRKALLGPDGQTVNLTWAAPQTLNIRKTALIDIPISRPDSLHLVAYVQDKNTREILQSDYVKIISKTTAPITGIEDELVRLAEQMKIYPNPANGTVYIGLPEGLTGAYNWRISDQRGVEVLLGDFSEAINNQMQIDVSNLPNGMYIVNIGTPGGRAVYRKLMVMNRN